MSMPYKMMYTNNLANAKECVLVYDWIHDIESASTYALCWMTETKMWLTVPVYMLNPIERV